MLFWYKWNMEYLYFSVLYTYFSVVWTSVPLLKCILVHIDCICYGSLKKEGNNKKLKNYRILSLGCIWFWIRILLLKAWVWRCSIELGSILWCKIFSAVRHWSVDKMCNGSTTSTYKIFLSSILWLVPWHIPSRQCAW